MKTEVVLKFPKWYRICKNCHGLMKTEVVLKSLSENDLKNEAPSLMKTEVVLKSKSQFWDKRKGAKFNENRSCIEMILFTHRKDGGRV